MHFYPQERIALFIDGASLSAASISLGFEIDFRRLLTFFRDNGKLVRALYYTVYVDDQRPTIRPLIDWLSYNGFCVITKSAKEYVDSSGRRRIKTSLYVELAVDALRLADSCDHVVLFASDGNLRVLVEGLQQKGKRVTILSTLRTQPPIVADELRRQADHFIDIADLQNALALPDRKVL